MSLHVNAVGSARTNRAAHRELTGRRSAFRRLASMRALRSITTFQVILLDDRGQRSKRGCPRPTRAPCHFPHFMPAHLALKLSALLVAFLFLPLASTEAQQRDSYESLDTSWKLADHDCGAQLSDHRRTLDESRSGEASELIRFYASRGTYVHLTSPLAPTRVIDELRISLWVKSNRPGAQLSARVALPRVEAPRSEETLTTLISGSSYKAVGKWEKLEIQLPAQQLKQQVPSLRSQFGSHVSDREAYVDMLVLNAYGGPGDTRVWLDDLEVTGQVEVANVRSELEKDRDTPAAAGLQTSKNQPPPKFEGGVLTVEERPHLVRAIDANGESFAWLKSLGFNTVCLPSPPTSEQLQEAEESGMWLITPPPRNHSPLEYGEGLKRIVAWELGRSLQSEQVETIRRRAQRLRSVPEHAKRPVIGTPREATWQYSRIANLPVLEPPGPNNSLQLAEYGRWYEQRRQLMRMGTHFWASVPTQLAQEIVAQQRILSGRTGGEQGDEILSLEPEQIRLLTYHAVASGARGLLFRSSSRLDGQGRWDKLRADTVRRLNQELSLIEPWAATGTFEGELETSDPAVRVTTLKTERSRLVLVIRRAVDQQYVAGPVPRREVSFAVPGVPETDEVYQVGADGLRRLPQRRSASLRVQLDQPRLITPLVITQDPLIINFLARQTASLRERQDELIGDIATGMYAAVVETHQQLLDTAPSAGLSQASLDTQALERARYQLQQFQRLVERGGHDRAYEFLQRGREQLAIARYHAWKSATSRFPAPVSSPLCVSFSSLPAHYAVAQRVRNASWGPNLLPGGDFENLALLQSSGWSNVSTDSGAWGSGAELSLQNPHSGRSSLRLRCWPLDPDRGASAIESAPLQITTAPVRVQRGQVVCVHGWVRIPQALEGGGGLQLYDSLSGKTLVQRIRVSERWKEFLFYRGAVRDGTFRFTAALSGIGEVLLDDITVRVLDPRSSQATLPHGKSPR